MPGKTYDQFLRSDQVQWEWWNAFKIDRPSITLLPDLSADAFKRTFYTPLVYEMTRERTHKFLAPVDEYDTGGSLEDEGDLAIRIAFVPLVAFAFSMADAYVHIFKTSCLASRTDSRKKSLQFIVGLAALGATLFYFFPVARTHNDITTSTLLAGWPNCLTRPMDIFFRAFSSSCIPAIMQRKN